MSGDHAERLETAYTTRRAKVAGTRPDVVEVLSADLRAALDELKQLRAQQKPALGTAYAAGWSDAISACRTPGRAEREAGWKRFLGELRSEGELEQPAQSGDATTGSVTLHVYGSPTSVVEAEARAARATYVAAALAAQLRKRQK